VRVAGLVTVRQRPGTASGVTFVTLEDETGVVNLVIWLRIAEAQRRVLLESRLLAVDGRVQRANGVQHVVARTPAQLQRPARRPRHPRSRDFH
jgi:error-prone DNA polymerase